MADAATFGQVVREARLAKGLSMGQLASAVGRTGAAVRTWERDEAAPEGDVLSRLAEVLELDAGNLEELIEPIASPPPEDEGADPFENVPGSQTGALPIVTDAEVTAATEAVAAVEDENAWTLRWFRDSMLDPERPYLGYARAALTVVFGIVMLWVLVWAAGELVSALGEVLSGFGIGE